MRFLLFAAMLASMTLHAQEQAEQPADPDGRTAWFVSTSLPEGMENPVKVLSGKDLSEITLSKRSTSEPVRIPADGILHLVREQPDPLKAKEAPYIILAQAQVPQGVDKALVILVPLAKPEGDLLFGAKVQSLSGFRGGDWLYLNLTRADIGVQMGNDRTLVKPGSLAIRSAKGLREAVNTSISYNFRAPGEQEWKLITSSTITVMPTRREICIFSADPKFGRISYHGVTFPVE